ncbi:MAG: SMP-30/gluconolactonase/LRE family protein [Pseudomonadota bacterium]
MDFIILAEDLAFPEGPIVMPDGSIIVVEIARGQVTRLWGEDKREIIAKPGGGPNGAAIGPDGALWICNNGGLSFHERDGLLIPGHCPEDYSGGRLERIDLATGRVERVLDSVDGHPLKGPNDLVFDKAGNLYFTDHGKSYPRHRDYGGLFMLPAGATEAKTLSHTHVSPNGVGLSPDEKTVYMADTLTARVWAFDLASPGDITPADQFSKPRHLATLPGSQYLDSLAVTEAGNVCVATLLNGGITIVTPEGFYSHWRLPDPFVTNICFGGEDMRQAFMTLSGTGRLAQSTWREPGLKLAF